MSSEKKQEQPDEEFSIEELSRRTGLTVRNIRELQTRGLVDPPTLHGRRGVYTRQHLARVALIRRLRDRGYSLAGIADLLRSWKEGAGIDALLGLEMAVTTPATTPQQSRGDEATVRELLPGLLDDPELLETALEVELLARHEDGSVYAPSVELLQIGRSFVKSGVPLQALLDEMRALRLDMEKIAARYRAMFDTYIFSRMQQAGLPPEAVKELAEAIVKLRAIGVRAATIILAQATERGGLPEVE